MLVVLLGTMVSFHYFLRLENIHFYLPDGIISSLPTFLLATQLPPGRG